MNQTVELLTSISDTLKRIETILVSQEDSKNSSANTFVSKTTGLSSTSKPSNSIGSLSQKLAADFKGFQVAGGSIAYQTKVLEHLQSIDSKLTFTNNILEKNATSKWKGNDIIENVSSVFKGIAFLPKPLKLKARNTASIFREITYDISYGLRALGYKSVQLGIKNVDNISKSVGNFIKALSSPKALILSNLKGKAKKASIINDMLVDIGTTFSLLGGDDSNLIKKGVKAVDSISLTIKTFAGSLAKLSMLSIIKPLASGAIKLISSASTAFIRIGKDEKLIKKGANAIKGIGKALISVSLGIASFGLAIAAVAGTGFIAAKAAGSGGFLGIASGLGAIGLGILTIWGLSKVFEKVGDGKSASNIAKGALAITAIGAAIGGLSLALGFAFRQPIFADENKWESLGFIAATVGGLGLEFALIGKFAKEVAKGSLAVLAIGASLWAFGFGISKAFQLPIFADENRWESLGFIAATIGGLGLVYAGLGALGSTGLPFIGAAVVAAIGGSIWLFGFGLSKTLEQQAFKGNFKETLIAIGEIGVTMGLLAAAYAGIGALGLVGLPFVGAAVVAAIGGSLLAFSSGWGKVKSSIGAGNKSFADFRSDMLYLAEGLSAIVNEFAISPILAFKAIAGAKAVEGIGKSLTNIMVGLKAWQSNSIPYKEFKLTSGLLEGTAEPSTLLDSIVMTINAIREPFAAIGAKSSAGKSLFSLVFSGKNDVEEGIKAVMGTSKALKSVSEGLKAWQKNAIPYKEFKLTSGLLEGTATPSTLLDSIVMTINAIREPFAAIGAKSSAGKSLFSLLFSSKNDVEEGIKAVLNTHKALKSISDGLKTWQTSGLSVKDFTKTISYDEKTGSWVTSGGMTLVDTIALTLVTLPNLFAQLGEIELNSRKKILGIPITKGNIGKGIQLGEKMGVSLKNMADALKVFDSTKNIQVAAQQASTFMGTYLGAVKDLVDEKDGKDLNKKLKLLNGYLEKSKDALKAMKSIEETSATLKGFNSFKGLFNEFSNLPLNDVNQMLDRLLKVLQEMKSMNGELLDKQVKIFEKQAEIAKAQVGALKDKAASPALPAASKSNVSQQVAADFSTIESMLAAINDAIEELNHTLEDGSARIKVINLDEIKQNF